MVSLSEALASQKPQLGAAVDAGWKTLAQDEQLTFAKYRRLILPFDGYVFWVREGALSKGAAGNTSPLNAWALNYPARVTTASPTLVVEGSIHVSSDLHQEEAKTYSVNRVVLTTDEEIQDLNALAPDELYICSYEETRFAFSSRGYFFDQAQTWHYAGAAVYSDMDPQIVDDPATFDSANVVVSNSLPLWLALNTYVPIYPLQPQQPSLTLWPSFLSPQNEAPPYATVHILPETTKALSAAPFFDKMMTHTQQARETVRVTLKGTRNFNAQDFIDVVSRYTVDYGTFGIANMPIVRDDKLGQVELTALSM